MMTLLYRASQSIKWQISMQLSYLKKHATIMDKSKFSVISNTAMQLIWTGKKQKLRNISKCYKIRKARAVLQRKGHKGHSSHNESPGGRMLRGRKKQNRDSCVMHGRDQAKGRDINASICLK